jgi:hypothetical protein
MKNMKRKYIKILLNNSIYKETKDKNIFLKVTPWKNGEDRRLTANYLARLKKQNMAVNMSFSKAREELNTVWNNHSTEWIHNGKEYKVKANDKFIFTKDASHVKVYKWTNCRGEEYTYTEDYYLCYYQGKVYWTHCSQYYPQLYLYHATTDNIEDETLCNGQWTNVKNIRPIYVKDMEKWKRT